MKKTSLVLSKLRSLFTILLNCTAFFFLWAKAAFAQTLTCSEYLCDPHNTYCGILCQIVPQVPNFIIGGGVVAAIVFICINGVNYMSAADDVKKITNARKGLTWAAIGLGAIIISFAVIRAIALLIGTDPTQLFIIRNVGNCSC